MLTVRNLTVSIAAATIVHDVDLDVATGGLTGLVGRNGAGKTTCMRAIMGLVKIVAGDLTFDDTPLSSVPAHQRARLGIGYLPEDRRLVPELSVTENVMLPAWAARVGDAAARLQWIYDLMPEVAQFADRKAMQLSGGQQKLAALARALMNGRHLLLLDEPFEGVAPALASRLADVLNNLKSEGLSVLLSESDATHSAGLVDHLYVIERGQVELRNSRPKA